MAGGITKLPKMTKGRAITVKGGHLKPPKAIKMSTKSTIPKIKAAKKISVKVASPLKFKA